MESSSWIRLVLVDKNPRSQLLEYLPSADQASICFRDINCIIKSICNYRFFIGNENIDVTNTSSLTISIPLNWTSTILCKVQTFMYRVPCTGFHVRFEKRDCCRRGNCNSNGNWISNCLQEYVRADPLKKAFKVNVFCTRSTSEKEIDIPFKARSKSSCCSVIYILLTMLNLGLLFLISLSLRFLLALYSQISFFPRVSAFHILAKQYPYLWYAAWALHPFSSYI